jgi:hypothetical protein
MFQETLPEIPADVSLMDDHPYQVRYPFRGANWDLVHWHTEYDRGVFGLIRHQYLLRYWELVLRRHPTAEIKALWHVDRIVRPTYGVAMQYAKEQLRHQWWNFQSQITLGCHQMLERGEKLPAGVTICTNFKRHSEHAPDEYYDKRHTYCLNCNEGFVFEKGLLQKLFWRNGYKILGPDEKRKIYKGHCNWARIHDDVPNAMPGRKLMVAGEKFGDHSDGVGIFEADEEYPPTGVKFFFHGIKMSVPKQLKALRAKVQAEEKRLNEACEAQRKLQNEARLRKEIQTIKDLFK